MCWPATNRKPFAGSRVKVLTSLVSRLTALTVAKCQPLLIEDSASLMCVFSHLMVGSGVGKIAAELLLLPKFCR